MPYKIYSLLFVCLLGLQINCQTRQASENIPDLLPQQTAKFDTSDEKIKELFVISGLGEEDGFLKELMTLPKERIIAVVQKLKENGLSPNDEQYFRDPTNETLKLKCAYFLWTLGVEQAANEKYILDGANKSGSIRYHAREYLMGLVIDGKKEYLPVIFEDALKWYGASLYIQANFLDELERSPKAFLFYLSKMSFEIRKRVYEVIINKTEFFDEKRFVKIKAIVRKLKADKETKSIAEEFLREVSKDL